MATRRRDMGSSDIRARLGIQDAPEPEVVPEVTEESPEAASRSVAEQASAEAVAGGVPPTASVSDFAHENYAEAVIDPDEEPTHVVEDDWRDMEPVATPSTATGKVAVIAGVAALAIGLGLGLGIGKVSEANKSVNMQTNQAATLLEPIESAASRIAVLSNELDSMNIERYSEELDARLAQDFGAGSSLALSTSQLIGSRMILADGDAGPAVTELVSSLQTLDAMVKRHLALTQRDLPDIQRELAGTQDKANYAVIFDVQESQRRYGEHMENPSDSGFMPVAGIRVTLPDNLDIVEQAQGGSSDYFYEIRLPNGQNSMVPIYAVISMQREQLVEGASAETPISRYVSRIAQIKEAVEATNITATRAQRTVNDVAGRGQRFGF